jgi:succinate dehydrogenase/fumarate reductase cytochrome b subunit
MDIILRAIAIFIEVIILMAMFYFILSGVRLILFDLGITQKYSRIVSVLLIAVGCVIAVFLISHLTAFYPPLGGG